MKKTNKENPITFFRKANEARQKIVKSSLKKAQDGIEMNDDLINKAGSKGGYKKPITRGASSVDKMPSDTTPGQIPKEKKGGSVKRKK
jgi:hypothetical protein